MAIYMVAAYAVFWVLTFVFVISLWLRQRRLERDIEDLRNRLELDATSD